MLNVFSLGILGPDGTFTSEAGFDYIQRRGLEADVEFYETIAESIKAIDRGEVERSIVPILNSTRNASWVNETLKYLQDFDAIKIYDEQNLRIDHNLASLPGSELEDITYVHSKDKALEQCKESLSELCPGAEHIHEDSTARAAKVVSEMNEKSRAAVVPERAAEKYDLNIITRRIQDRDENKTRFLVLGEKDHEPTGNDKTTVIFEYENVREPNLLVNDLEEFSRRDISLAYLQSIPKDGKLDEFTFYCDIHGHRKDEKVREALDYLKNDENLSYYKLLGSYPEFG